MPPARIAVLGSCMMDLVARVPRHPERGETVFGSGFATAIGGKGLNQAVAARRQGAAVALIGRIGADPFGDEIATFLDREGVDRTHLGVDPLLGTGVAIPLVYDDGGNSIVSVPRANLVITPGHVRAAAAAIRGADLLLLQLEVALDAVVEAVAIAVEAGVPVILNTAPVAPLPPGLLDAVTGVVANEVEAAALAPGSTRDPRDQARAFVGGAVRFAVVTLGAEGSVVADRHGATAVASFPVDAVDSVGAGDAFCGALGVAIAEGVALPEAVRRANAAGALAATRHGASPSLPSRAEVDRLLAAGR
ncbi:MAG: ribokinase [Chloroflexi bacterium]|nr:ribokinase [Chloroflexota bacterium]